MSRSRAIVEVKEKAPSGLAPLDFGRQPIEPDRPFLMRYLVPKQVGERHIQRPADSYSILYTFQL